jgi:hypothetical protein
MMRVRECVAAAAFLIIAHGTTLAAGPPGPLEDWPCPAPFADHLTPEAAWPGALPGALPDAEAWKADPQAKAIVEFVAGTENSPRVGAQYIDDFAKANGPIRPALAMLVLTGMVEQSNKIRDILIEGIHGDVVRSHILASAVHENDEHLAQALRQASSDPAAQPEAIRKARVSNLRSLDDIGDGAEMLCHRYSYDETKVEALAAALRKRTE